MYEAFFGLNDRPFAPAPLAKRYFPAGPAEVARNTLARCIDRGEGIGVLIGPAGTGKTLLCQVLAEQFRTRFSVALLSSGRICTRRNLFQAILFELGLPYRGIEEGELRLALVDHLVNQEMHNGGLLLLLDEAHTLPLRLLEEARLLTNLLRNGQPRVRLVLSGAAMLEERLASPKLESFNQRIAGRCYLQAFNHDETLAYIRAGIAGAGGNVDQVFAPDALRAIHRATDGIPRLVNQVCDHALILAYAGGMKQIVQAGVEEAWADLQQLPTPWNAAAGAADPAPDIIEFGALEEDVIPLETAVEKPAAPRLHAVREEDETDLFYGEPGERLEKIEAKLESIDSDYQPPLVAVAEVELVFPGPTDPFAESFAEEEVVVDRFADMESSVLANRPLVRSAEGRELSALLAPHETRDEDGPAVATQAASDYADAGQQQDDRTPWRLSGDEHQMTGATAEEIAMPDAVGLRPADDPVLPDEPATISIMIGGPAAEETPFVAPAEAIRPADEFPQSEVAEPDPEADAQVTEIGEVPTPEPVAETDQDLIIIEDDPPEPTPPSPAPPKARRQEYRQLFARLRRG